MGVFVPFLYLPDAVSLTLLLVLIGLLRRSAIIHVRQDLLRLRGEMFVWWVDKGLSLPNPAYMSLCKQIDSSVKLAPIFSPARLYFTLRLYRQLEKFGFSHLFSNPAAGFEQHIERIADSKTRDKLRRTQLEIDMSVGTLYLLASMSGWILTFPIFFRMITRSLSGTSENRVDKLFDLGERVLSRVGRRAQQLALATEPGQ